ncbi:MAG: ABC transporter substrate-binding protein [Rhodospirillaceae bacterium]|nr:ABC transporter substrate-binding protein [Rhodospirillaceae bacterium]
MRVCRTAIIATLSLLGFAKAQAQQGTLRIASPLFAPSIANPYQGLTLPSTIAVLPIFDPLVVIDDQSRVLPWLAVAWSSTDARVWTITMREGVVFSNGVPVTAEALVASADYLKTPKGFTTTIGSSFANIERAVRTGELTAEIHLKQPDTLFPQRMANWKIPEPKAWTASLDKDGEGRKGIGSGSFALVDDNPAKVVLTANPKAWNKPQAARLELLLLQEQMTRMQAMAANAIDIALQIGPGDREDLHALGGHTLNRKSTRVTYISFAKEHVPQSPINDPKVRLAMNYAINRQAIADVILGGTVTPVGQLVLPGAPGYVADIKPFAYDPARAKALLAEAGYPKGLEVSVRIAASGADEETFYQQIAQDLKAAGIKFTIIPAAMAQMTQMMFLGKFEADMFSNFGRGLDGLGDYRYRSCLGQTGINKPYFCDPPSLESVKQAQAATDINVIDQLMQQVTRREYENPPGVFLWQNKYLDGIGPRVSETPDYDKYYDYLPLHLIRMKN